MTTQIENKGGGEPAPPTMPAPQEQSCGASKEVSPDKRERESPDTWSAPEVKSLKTSGEPVSLQDIASGQATPAQEMSFYDTPGQESIVKERNATHRMANNAPEAKLQARAMHSRVPEAF